MNKKIVLLPVLLLSLVFFTACEQTKEASKYDNWQAKNQAYMDSLQNVFDLKKDPTLQVIKPTITAVTKKNIFYKKLAPIAGITPSIDTPLYTDTVKVHYRGQMIDGTVFDNSYKGTEPDFNFEVTRKFTVNGVVSGWTEMLQLMKKGDHVKVYIPYQCGYGVSGSGAILGYSTLIFDVYLVDFWKPKPAPKSN